MEWLPLRGWPWQALRAHSRSADPQLLYSFFFIVAGQHSAGMALARTAFRMSGRIRRKIKKEGTYSGLDIQKLWTESEESRRRSRLSLHFL
jgi:hypothetical protein